MRYLPALLLLALLFSPPVADARSAVLLIIDGLGSSYLAGHEAAYSDGTPMEPVDVPSFGPADARYELFVPVPSTEYGHAVIATGDRGAAPEDVSAFHATVFDALHDDGYLALGILENGDSAEFLAELDAAVRVTNNSVYSPGFAFVRNGDAVPSGLAAMMRDYPRLDRIRAGKDPYSPYIRYNAWAIGFAADTVEFVNMSMPQADYLLVVNAGGLDSAGHALGDDGYRAVLAGMDGSLGALVEACRNSDTALIVTADHGMSFPGKGKRGSHANAAAASRNESRLVPLFIYGSVAHGGGTYGQECLAPTLLSLLDEPDTLSLGDGAALPVKDRPTLFLMSDGPVDVAVSGEGVDTSIMINGTYRLSSLEKGDYVLRYGGKSEKVRVAGDVVVHVRDEGEARPEWPPWIAYGPLIAIPLAGIAIALRLSRRGLAEVRYKRRR